jgi:hypothetical protein
MFRLLADENFRGNIVRGLIRLIPTLDITRVQDEGLSGADDPSVLAWAADNDRIVLTHDLQTMPVFAFERVNNGQKMPGMFYLSQHFPAGSAIKELQLVLECSQPEEWIDTVLYLPL